MGRTSLNRTYEEMLKKHRDAANEYYRLNKEAVNKKRRDKYEQLKCKSINKKK